MTETTSAQSPSSRSGGRCCLWGCGGCLVVLAALLLAAGIAYVRFGAPWLEAKKAELLGRFPRLAAAVQLKDALRPLADRRLEGGAEGSTRREDFPQDVFLPPGDRQAVFNSSGDVALAVLTFPSEEMGRLAAGIRAQMAELGWTRRPVPDPHDGVGLLFLKDARAATYKIFAGEDGTEVWVQVIRGEATR